MYPRLSDLLNDILGTDIRLPIQTYGFFVAMAFLTAATIMYFELKRKEREKIIFPTEKIRVEGKPASWRELIITALVSFALGYKIIGAVVQYDYFSEYPQKFLFSGEGSWLGGIVAAALITWLTYRDRQKKKKDTPVRVKEMVHPRQLTGGILLVAAVFGIVGSKIFDVAENLDQLFKDPVHTLFSFSGLTFYGGLIVAAVAVSVYVERNNIPWRVNADVVAPALMLAYGIGRIGCQLSGDGCWGVENTAPKPEWLGFLPDWMWAFRYPHNVINEGILMPGCEGSHCHILEQPVFPTPFYETVIAVILFGILWSIRKKFSLPGTLFCIYLIFNGTARFFIEQIRVNKRYDIFGIETTQASVIAIVLILTGVAGIFIIRWYHLRVLAKRK